MPSIQIKDVPPETHLILRRRASESGQSLQEYLRSHLIEEARTPTNKELFDRIERYEHGGSVPLDEAAELIRADRDRR